jgi:pSer/pThr/pTyr-binding forkhead associated (FHA) protein
MAGLRQHTDAGERIFRIDGTLSIGRDPHNDLVLADNVVSNWHASIEEQSGTCTLLDLQSLNGTYVQRGATEPERLQAPHALQTGDAIRIGSARLVFEASIPARPSPAAERQTPPVSHAADRTSAFPPTEQGRVVPVVLGWESVAPAASGEDSVLQRLRALEERVSKLEAALKRREPAD